MRVRGNPQSLYDEESWIEFLEGEVDSSLYRDMEVLLVNSEADRKILEDITLTREMLKAMDEVALPEDGHFYNRMHAKIMTAIQVSDQEKLRLHPGGADFGELPLDRERKQVWSNFVKALLPKRD